MKNQLLKHPIFTLPTEPTNLIFTGVAGTGKTHRLLAIQQLYDEVIDSSWAEWRVQQIQHLSWCDVVCAVLLLEDRMMTVPEMMRHPLIKDKMVATNRHENINQTLWVQLNIHAHPESKTVNYTQRSANYYFDKTSSSHWYILDEIKKNLQQRLADHIALYRDNSSYQMQQPHKVIRSCMVSFHQSYGYDEFIEGIRPRINPQTGQMQYDIQNGAFVALCDKAVADPEHRYAMLIDEINRANTAQVFGELMSVIEPSKRSGSITPMSVRLAYSGRQFSVPNNVDIYATMNTQDHSLAALDTAFRRRFEFVTCQPDSSLVGVVSDIQGVEIDVAKLMDVFNQRIAVIIGDDAQLGHSYFMGITDIAELARRLYRQVIPQIMHHIKQIAAPFQTESLLKQVLYGEVDDNHIIEGCVLKRYTKPTFNDDGFNKQQHAPLNNGQVTFTPAFIKAANSEVDSDFDDLEINGSANVFLSAQPYHQMYKLS